MNTEADCNAIADSTTFPPVAIITLSITCTVPFSAVISVAIILEPLIKRDPSLLTNLLVNPPKAEADVPFAAIAELGKFPLETWYNKVFVKKGVCKTPKVDSSKPKRAKALLFGANTV